MTRILSANDVRSILTVEKSLQVLHRGFSSSIPVAGQRHRTDLPFPGTATALLPGTLEEVPAFTMKTNVKFPGAAPALRGVVCLHSGSDGKLLAILDSAVITAWRTGLSAALATDLLSRMDATTTAVIGAGAQAGLTVRGLKFLRGQLDLIVYDTSTERAESFVKEHGGRIVTSPSHAAGKADIVLLATWSREPVLGDFSMSAGQHITTLGSDEPGKRELGQRPLRQSLLVVDDVEQSRAMGVLSQVERNADATLSEVITGRLPGRTYPEQNTVYAPVGLPWQDLALAWLVYQTAEAKQIGTVLDFSD